MATESDNVLGLLKSLSLQAEPQTQSQPPSQPRNQMERARMETLLSILMEYQKQEMEKWKKWQSHLEILSQQLQSPQPQLPFLMESQKQEMESWKQRQSSIEILSQQLQLSHLESPHPQSLHPSTGQP